LAASGGGFYFFMQAWKRNEKVQMFMDRLMLKVPIFGVLVEKSCVPAGHARCPPCLRPAFRWWRRLTRSGGAAGNSVYAKATDKIQQEVSTGTSLTAAMGNANIFPTMVLQMCAIGEESGSIDHMLGKAADFYEAEVDDMVAGLSSLMEPIIIVFLGHHHRWHRGVDVPARSSSWVRSSDGAESALVEPVLAACLGCWSAAS
jgi:type IV pilus assembly protein PilC